MPGPTLITPPAPDPSRSPIENVLALTPLSSIGPDIFTNTRELWHPPGARGVYGGAVIAQCLSAAQSTIPSSSPEYLIHSMHCYFVLAGDSTIPILYHVERVRDGKSFMTRTVQARQKGRCIFTTTCSFMREGSGGRKAVEHAWRIPEGVAELMPSEDENEGRGEEGEDPEGNGVQTHGPFISRRLGVSNNDSPHPYLKKPQQWIRSLGQISPSAGQQAHLSALAYMSDSYFIGTVARVHNLWRFGGPSSKINLRPSASRPSPSTASPPSSTTSTHVSRLAAMEAAENAPAHSRSPGKSQGKVGMMVSLDHTIYFHRPREIRADEWLLSEMESPWSGEGRGLVLQRIWNKSGVLLASCVQEVR
ncbi:hypothetical protein G7Y79_00001g002990 [Physcia stellaris]|nr:hypothetical protein G7Y79_00001g002990 [Physcia stellaris]